LFIAGDLLMKIAGITLMETIDAARLRIWSQQDADFFREATEPERLRRLR
jgi:hypothetical protein